MKDGIPAPGPSIFTKRTLLVPICGFVEGEYYIRWAPETIARSVNGTSIPTWSEKEKIYVVLNCGCQLYSKVRLMPHQA
jgi:hypothetical protein